MEMTTGMSAPPIGMMIRMPIDASDSPVISQKTNIGSSMKTSTATKHHEQPAPAGIERMAHRQKTIGLPDMRAVQLAAAMTEPVNVMAPMATPKRHLDQAAGEYALISPMPKAMGDIISAAETSTAARPTN